MKLQSVQQGMMQVEVRVCAPKDPKMKAYPASSCLGSLFYNLSSNEVVYAKSDSHTA